MLWAAPHAIYMKSNHYAITASIASLSSALTQQLQIIITKPDSVYAHILEGLHHSTYSQGAAHVHLCCTATNMIVTLSAQPLVTASTAILLQATSQRWLYAPGGGASPAKLVDCTGSEGREQGAWLWLLCRHQLMHYMTYQMVAQCSHPSVTHPLRYVVHDRKREGNGSIGM